MYSDGEKRRTSTDDARKVVRPVCRMFCVGAAEVNSTLRKRTSEGAILGPYGHIVGRQRGGGGRTVGEVCEVGEEWGVGARAGGAQGDYDLSKSTLSNAPGGL